MIIPLQGNCLKHLVMIEPHLLRLVLWLKPEPRQAMKHGSSRDMNMGVKTGSMHNQL